MTLPLTTTTGTITRPGAHEPFEAPASTTTVATGVEAHVSTPTAFERGGDAGGERIDAALLIDPGTAVERGDIFTDDYDGRVYRVATVTKRTGFGLDHQRIGLVHARGEVPA